MNDNDASGLDRDEAAPIVPRIADRFRGFLPVVVDVETGGFNPQTDALLEIAAVLVRMDDSGTLSPAEVYRFHVKPFPGANMDPESLAITGIDPHHPLRPDIDERDALQRVFREVRRELRAQNCSRAILVGHNSFFDLQFLNAAVARSEIKRNPFHPFSSFDTVSLAGLAYGQTVLARAAAAAGERRHRPHQEQHARPRLVQGGVLHGLAHRPRP
jgi:ribonuclease T